MRNTAYLISLIGMLAVGCGDRQEESLEDLEKDGYGFVVDDFLRAAETGDVEIAKRFLDSGMAVDVKNADGTTPFRKAAEAEQDGMIRFLLEAGADPNQRLSGGGTALMLVAARPSGGVSLMEALLRSGADAKLSDEQGMTATMIAAYGGNVDAVRKLAPRDVDSLDRALMLAAMQGHTHCMEALINQGVYVNSRSSDDQTPLMYAAAKGKNEAVMLLLQHHANKHAIDREERTAADQAEVEGFLPLAKFLREGGDLLVSNPDVEGVEGTEDNFQQWEDSSSPIVTLPPSLDGQVLPPPPSGEIVLSAADAASGEQREPERELTKRVKLAAYREAYVPVLLKTVPSNAEKAKVRILTQRRDIGEVEVRKGDVLPGTDLRVTRLEHEWGTDKAGEPIETSRMMAKSEQGEEKVFLNGEMTLEQPAYAIIEVPDIGKSFTVREGDLFKIEERGQHMRVSAVRPHQILLQDIETDEVLTIKRESVVDRIE